jgi:hypothetical protein
MDNQILWKELQELRERIHQLERKMIQQEMDEARRHFDFWMKMGAVGIWSIAVLVLITFIVLRIVGAY